MPSRFRWLAIVSLTAASLSAGCSSPRLIPDFRHLYDAAARHYDETRNPVIVIPGILGTKLVDSQTDRVVWGAFSGTYANPNTKSGARLVALPMEEGSALREIDTTIEPAGVLDRIEVNFLGLPLRLRAYVDILRTLGVAGYRDQSLGISGAIDYGDAHFSCFQFAYDWRLDNVQNARRLHEYILESKAYVETELERRFGITDHDVKFDIVAHSMGGLLARYYLRYGTAEPPPIGSGEAIPWAGAEHVERVVLIGTPNAGSVEALQQLVEGVRFATFLPKYHPAVLGTMPSIYQLLPRSRHIPLMDVSDPRDPLDPELWKEKEWGLLAPDQDSVLRKLLPDAESRDERLRIARDHQEKCLERARLFTAALDRPSAPPEGLRLYAITGDAVPTLARVAAEEGGKLTEIEKRPGDGTVLRTSVLMDERVGGTWTPTLRSPIRWWQVMFLFTDHLGMTRDPAFIDNVLYILLEDPR